ncbi:M3 family metallopeptidase [Corynebacterium freneyi]|uniref:M3 family metallopeptidase n=1 Tax=Corynebacterium freneyi TaxID=134034 RepID=UPI001CCFF15F|nr:M3 family metallopeptidase [Corynebacterium freneyi]UBI01714.1 M3 family metallopeptidase [Corynebacterium freneyi]
MNASSSETIAANPLLTPSTLPYGLPDFGSIGDEHVIPAFRTAFVDHDAEIAAIVDNPEAPTFANTLEALEKSGRLLDRVAAYFFNIAGTDATEERLAIEAAIAPELAAHMDGVRLNEGLWARIKKVAELYDESTSASSAGAGPDAGDADRGTSAASEVPELDDEARRLLDKVVRDFRRAGADLDDAGKARLKEINARLSELSTAFGENLLADTNDRAVAVTDEADLAGLSDAAKDNLARYARKAGRADGWLIPLDLPSVQAILTDLESPDTRARVYAASIARGTGAGHDNRPVLLEEVRLRAEKARLLGYDTHADYVISDETAGDVAAAKKLITDLAPAAVANAEGEYKRVADLAAEETVGAGAGIDGADDAESVEGAGDVGAPDWPYWAERRRAEEFAVDGEKLKAYFQLDRVLRDGVFHVAKKLYGIDVVPREDLAGYAPGVTVWEVRDGGADGGAEAGTEAGADTGGGAGAESRDSGIGLLLTDFFSRPTKRGGAWMSSFVDQSHLLGTKPVVVNVLNIAEPAEGEPALLTLDEVTTLFHEFGHALHGLLSDVRYPRFSGTNVPRDFVEFPSQINENWALEPSILANYAFHVDTGEPIPDDLVEAVKRARTAGEGFATAEYLAASALDLAWHSLSPEEAAAVTDVGEFEQKALEEYGLDVANLAPRYRSTYFNHIFAGGYSAGYYSYLWAEALDADGYGWFTDNGGATRAGGDHFRATILSRGGAIDFTEAYRTFRRRDKDIRPLLERRGLAGADVG